MSANRKYKGRVPTEERAALTYTWLKGSGHIPRGPVPLKLEPYQMLGQRPNGPAPRMPRTKSRRMPLVGVQLCFANM